MTPEQMRRAASLLFMYANPHTTRGESYADEKARPAEAIDLARLLREQADAQGWRPIETAPRDGTRILLWRDWLTLDDRAVCYWHSDLRNWYAVGQYVFNDALLWQPLPPPPQTGGG